MYIKYVLKYQKIEFSSYYQGICYNGLFLENVLANSHKTEFTTKSESFQNHKISFTILACRLSQTILFT